jgi:hypothetical protein
MSTAVFYGRPVVSFLISSYWRASNYYLLVLRWWGGPLTVVRGSGRARNNAEQKLTFIYCVYCVNKHIEKSLTRKVQFDILTCVYSFVYARVYRTAVNTGNACARDTSYSRKRLPECGRMFFRRLCYYGFFFQTLRTTCTQYICESYYGTGSKVVR